MKIIGRTNFEGTRYAIIDYSLQDDEEGRQQLTLFTSEQAIVIHYWESNQLCDLPVQKLIPRNLHRSALKAEALHRLAGRDWPKVLGPDDYLPFPAEGSVDNSDRAVLIEAPRPHTPAEQKKISALLDTGAEKQPSAVVPQRLHEKRAAAARKKAKVQDLGDRRKIKTAFRRKIKVGDSAHSAATAVANGAGFMQDKGNL